LLILLVRVGCKNKCLYLSNTAKRLTNYLFSPGEGVCKYCKECEYFVLTADLRCICCHNKFSLKNSKRQTYKINIRMKKEKEDINDTSEIDYTQKINSLLDLSYVCSK